MYTQLFWNISPWTLTLQTVYMLNTVVQRSIASGGIIDRHRLEFISILDEKGEKLDQCGDGLRCWSGMEPTLEYIPREYD